MPTWLLIVAALMLAPGGLVLLLTVEQAAEFGVPILVLGLVALWELGARWMHQPENTPAGMLYTVIGILLLAAVMFVVAAAVPAATNALRLGIVILLIGLGLGLYQGWTWRKELAGQTGATAGGRSSGALEREKRTALILVTSLAGIGVVGMVVVLLTSPDPLFLLAITLPIAATAAVFAYKLRDGVGSGRPPR